MKRCILLFFISFWCLKAFGLEGIVVFGDSLTDQGNNVWVEDEGRKGKTKGAPITNWPAEPEKGRVWFQYLSNAVNVSGLSESVAGGVNINSAWASAETGNVYLNDRPGPPFSEVGDCVMPGLRRDGVSCVPGVLKQVELFLASDVKNKEGRFYILFGGGNDVIDNILRVRQWLAHEKEELLHWLHLDHTSPAGLLAAQEVSESVSGSSVLHQKFAHPIQSTVQAVELLVSAGVPKSQIAVMSLPDLSRAPIGRHLTAGWPAVLKLLKGFCEGYSDALKLSLDWFGFGSVKTLDIFQWQNDTLNNKAALGFLYGEERDCVHDGAQEACDGYFFFNGKHMTTQVGHRLLGEWVSKELSPQLGTAK